MTETEVNGPHFEALSHPLANMKNTYCVHCGQMDSVHEFVWTDTNERISDYYARYCRNAKPSDLWWCGRSGLLLFAVVGIGLALLASWMMRPLSPLVWGGLAIVGALVGAFSRDKFISPAITRKVCGVSDTRRLQ